MHPDEFRWVREQGKALGFGSVFAGPLVRSSYRADEPKHAAAWITFRASPRGRPARGRPVRRIEGRLERVSGRHNSHALSPSPD